MNDDVRDIAAIYDEQTFEANGVKINFVRASDSGDPILLVHGTASEWQSFLPIISALAPSFKVYALDLRGHGGSSWVSNQYHLSGYAKDILCFLEQYLAQPAILYGHSLGAQIALAVAAQAPACVRALVLGDIPFYYHNATMKETIWYEPFMELLHVTRSFHSAQEIEDYIAENYPNMDEQRRKSRAGTLSHVDPDVVATILEDRHMEGIDLDALLRQITCPVLLLQGDPKLGAALRDEDVVYMMERLSHCDIVHMQDIGHGLPTGESLARVETFLNSV